MNRLTFAALMALFCFGAIYDQPDLALQEAKEVSAAQHSRDFAAQQVCGENAAWEWLDDQNLQCYTHRGHRTGGKVLVAGGAK